MSFTEWLSGWKQTTTPRPARSCQPVTAGGSALSDHWLCWETFIASTKCFLRKDKQACFFFFVLFFKIISPSQPSTCGCHILTLFLISVYDWVNRSATGQRRRADVCLWRLILRLRNSGWRTETVFNKRRDSTAPCHGEKSFRFCCLNSTQLPVGPCFSPCPAADLSRSFCPLSTYSVDFFDFHQFTFFFSLTVYVFFLFFPATAWIITCHRLTFEWTWHSYWNLK